MSEDTSSTQIPILTASNYRMWAARIKGLADSWGVWQYVNLASNAIRVVRTAPPTCGDINVTIAVPAQGDQPATTHTRPARHTGELSTAEKDELKYAQHDWHVKDN